MAEKKCTRCGETKPVTEFPNDRSRKDGKFPHCKECNRKHASEWRSENPDGFKKYYKDNKDAVLSKTQAWRNENLEHTRSYAREYYAANTSEQRQRSRAWKSKNKQAVAEYNKAYKTAHSIALADQARAWRENNKHLRSAAESKRKAAKLRATPVWFERDKVLLIYEKAQEFGAHVDHVVPLKHPLVCGLHCWHNLQLLPPDINCSKGNRRWPDMP